MKHNIIFLALIFIASNALAQKRVVENAIHVAALAPATNAKEQENKKAVAVTNKSADRTITVRLEESVMTNNYLEKKIIAVEKIGPNQQKFVGYAGCDTNVYGTKCIGYKIALAYYDDVTPPVAPKKDDKVAQVMQAGDGDKITAK